MLVSLLGEGTQYLQSAVLINRLLLTIKRAAHFPFGPWHVINVAQTPARAAAKGTLDLTDPGQELPARLPSSPRTQLPASRIYGFGILSPWPRDTTYDKLEWRCNSHQVKSICAAFSAASPLLKVGQKLTGAREHKKRADA